MEIKFVLDDWIVERLLRFVPPEVGIHEYCRREIIYHLEVLEMKEKEKILELIG